MIVTLSGENRYALSQELNQKVSKFVAEFGDISLERLDGAESDYARLRESLQSLPFLASRKLVVIKNSASSNSFTDNAKELFAELPETTDLICVDPKLDKRSAYYKLLKSKTDFREFGNLDGFSLAKWLTDEAVRLGGKLSAGDAKFMIDRVGQNQQLLASELEKLILYDSSITKASIELLTDQVPQSKIFDLLEAAFVGNKVRTMSLYDDQRAQKVDTSYIISMLTWQLRIISLIKAGKDMRSGEIASEAGLNPYVIEKSQALAQLISIADLIALISNLLAIDIKSKSKNIDVDEALKTYLLKLTELAK